MREAISLLLLLMFLGSCQNQTPEAPSPAVALDQQDALTAFALLEQNCFSCHNPQPSTPSKVAPSMKAVKEAYLTHAKSQADFVAAWVHFLNAPTEASALMTDAVGTYGLMPKMGFSEEQLRLIAAYIYQEPLEMPDWFSGAYQQQKNKLSQVASQDTSLSYLEMGRQHALATKGVLGKNLLQALNSKGTEHALAFCNTRAYPLTDSMSEVAGLSIRRVSDRPRNAQNQANEWELAYIKAANTQLGQGQEPKPSVQEIAGEMVGYYPITTNKMCLQCHGKPEDIQPATLQRIKTLYPTDKATGYGADELRGIFVVKMPKREK